MTPHAVIPRVAPLIITNDRFDPTLAPNRRARAAVIRTRPRLKPG